MAQELVTLEQLLLSGIWSAKLATFLGNKNTRVHLGDEDVLVTQRLLQHCLSEVIGSENADRNKWKVINDILLALMSETESEAERLRLYEIIFAMRGGLGNNSQMVIPYVADMRNLPMPLSRLTTDLTAKYQIIRNIWKARKADLPDSCVRLQLNVARLSASLQDIQDAINGINTDRAVYSQITNILEDSRMVANGVVEQINRLISSILYEYPALSEQYLFKEKYNLFEGLAREAEDTDVSKSGTYFADRFASLLQARPSDTPPELKDKKALSDKIDDLVTMLLAVVVIACKLEKQLVFLTPEPTE